MIPIEVKLSTTVDRYAVAGLRQFMKDLDADRGWVVASTGGGTNGDITTVPWQGVTDGSVDFGL